MVNYMRVIISADADGPGCHAEMLPLCSASWRKFMPEIAIEAVIIGADPTEKYIERYGRLVDGIHIIKPSGKYSIPIVSKCARLWRACQFPGSVITIEDVDLILCQRKWHMDNFEKWKPGRIMRMGAEYYKTITHESGKAPMSKFVCDSDMMREIVNPNDLPFDKWIEQFDGVNILDMHGRENIAQPGNFSDESLLRALIHRWGHWELVDDIIRDWGNDEIYILDRARWARIDWNQLLAGNIYEGHILKPYYENLITVSAAVARGMPCDPGTVGLKPLIEYIGYDEPALRTHDSNN